MHPTGVGRFDLDDNLRRQTLLVEVVAGASRSHGALLRWRHHHVRFGELWPVADDRCRHRTVPIATAYVKVYAKYPDGSVRFYKDGYTDSRGRFDYASVSAGDAKGATQVRDPCDQRRERGHTARRGGPQPMIPVGNVWYCVTLTQPTRCQVRERHAVPVRWRARTLTRRVASTRRRRPGSHLADEFFGVAANFAAVEHVDHPQLLDLFVAERI